MQFQVTKKILIIGGNGFIGSHLCDALLGQNYAIRVLDKFSERFRLPNPSIEYQLEDFSDDAVINRALEGIDLVVHLVSTTVPGTSNLNCVYDIESNLIPTVKLLNAMRVHNCAKIIYLSSGGTVYGNATIVPTPENTLLQPISSYGIVKAAIENYITMYSKLYDIQSLIIRPSNLYGNRQGQAGVQGLIHTLLEKISTNQAITIWGDGHNVRDYIYIDDLIDMLCLCISKNASGVYNAGCGVGYSVNEIIRMIGSETGEKPIVEYTEARSFDVEKMILDTQKAQNDLGWKVKMEIEIGIQRMWKNKLTKNIS